MEARTPGMTKRVPVLDRGVAVFMSLMMILGALMTFVPARTSATESANCGVVPIDLVFVIDRSGSMNTSEGAHTRLGWAKLAATSLVDLLNDPAGSVGTLHQVGVSSFGGSSTTRVVQLGTSNATTVNTAINGISGTGGTPFDIGMAEGADNMLDGDRATYAGEAVTQVLIFLSDGNPDPNSYTPNNTEIASYLASADKAYAVAIGPDGGDLGSGGTGVSYDLMRQISKPAYVNDGNPGGFRAVTSASGLPNLFAEIYEEISCPTGKLEVRKAINPQADAGRFDLWIGNDRLADEAGHNGTTGEHELAAGAYVVAETADGETSLDDYNASISCVDTAAQNAPVTATKGQGNAWSVDVTEGSDIVCTITNARNSGQLIVIKDLTTDDGADAACDDFSFTVNGGNPISFEADCSNAMTVAPGAYTVVETDADGFATSYANCSNLQVPPGGSATCTISNDDKPGTLIVNKVIDGGDAACDDFSFMVNGGDAIDFEADCGNSMTVPAGTYSVVETDADGYATSYKNCSQLYIPNGGSATCTITNEREMGSITVVKDLNPADDPGRFDLLIDGVTEADGVGDGGSTGAVSLETGSHTVGEFGDGSTSLANYASEIECRADAGKGSVVASGAGAGPLAVDVEADDDIVCVISNDRVAVGFDKSNDAGENAAVEPGDIIGYTLTVTVSSGTATNVVVSDELPAGLSYVADSADPSAGFAVNGQELTWTVGNLAAGTHEFTYDAVVDADASGSLTNLGCVDADQNDELVCDETTVLVQNVAITKTSDATDAVLPGTTVNFELELAVINGPIDSMTIVDQLPAGIGDASTISDGGVYDAVANTITWNLSDVADGDTLTYSAVVSASAAAGEYTNVATITDGPCVVPDCDDDETVVVRVPSLVIDKEADADLIIISGPDDALVADPAIVTWTLTYTLTDGPVTNAVISDVIPTGFVFLDAADGGVFAAGAVSWTFATLTESGSVSFRTTVDLETISRIAPTVNVATIESDQTGPDDGSDAVDVAVEPPPLGGTPTPAPSQPVPSGPQPSMPNTSIASSAGTDSGPMTLPLLLLAVVFIGSLGAMALANVSDRERRR